jgi:hypothetical protein
MSLNPPDRANDRTPYTFSSDRPAKEEYYTDYDEKSGTIMKKSDLQKRDGWVSPHPQRLADGSMNPDWHAYVSPEQQKENMEKANAPKPPKEEYYTDYDKKTGTIMKKSDLQKRDGWVSPWPQGHENYTEYVSPEQEAENMRKG